MSKLPTITPKKLIKIFEQLGFQIDHISGSHFVLYRATDKKRVTIPSHAKDLPKGTLLAILRQAEIDKNQLSDLLNN
ncbi:MAG: type II toxin-antitoxin system HicA family toxin [Minisyncoccales bacterium]|jgi:predicted RNA binding protein YcfA (HicA-like mRNA interferase family)